MLDLVHPEGYKVSKDSLNSMKLRVGLLRIYTVSKHKSSQNSNKDGGLMVVVKVYPCYKYDGRSKLSCSPQFIVIIIPEILTLEVTSIDK